MKTVISSILCLSIILSAVPGLSLATCKQDTTPPQVVITSPSENQTVSGKILLSASVSDPIVRGQKTSGIKAVRFFIDGTFYEIDKQAPYTAELDTTTLSDGLHTLQVRARDNAENKGKHKITFNVLNNPIDPPSDNLILNPSVEDCLYSPNPSPNPFYWHKGGWGTNTAVFTYPAEAHTGQKGASINISSYTNGDAKWYFDDVVVIPGENYIFSNYYKSTVPTRLTARYTMSDGTFMYLDLGYPATASNWTQFSASFTAPQNAISLTVFHLIETVGWLLVDDFSLVKESIPVYPFNQGMVTLSFDDGWLSSYQNGIPILNNYNIKSTQYIFTDALGTQGYITSSQMLDMQNQGHEIGAHSKTHSDLTTLNNSQLVDEILGSKQMLEAMGANTITSFAYPFGEWNENIKNIIGQSGYHGARTAMLQDGGFNSADQDPYLLKTFSIEINTPVSEVQKLINEAVNNKTWVILVFHQIENNGGQYSTAPQNLQNIASYISQNNIKTVTIGQGLNELGQ